MRKSLENYQPAIYLLVIFGLLTLLSSPIWANESVKSLKAQRFVVTERMILTDIQGQSITFQPGSLPLISFDRLDSESSELTLNTGNILLTEHSALIQNLHDLRVSNELQRGGNGEPPRGPLMIRLQNVVSEGRGLLEMNFSNRTVKFWLDDYVKTEPQSGAIIPQSVRASIKTTGQNVGLRMLGDPSPASKEPLSLLLLENNQSPAVEIELLRMGGDHTDPRDPR